MKQLIPNRTEQLGLFLFSATMLSSLREESISARDASCSVVHGPSFSFSDSLEIVPNVTLWLPSRLRNPSHCFSCSLTNSASARRAFWERRKFWMCSRSVTIRSSILGLRDCCIIYTKRSNLSRAGNTSCSNRIYQLHTCWTKVNQYWSGSPHELQLTHVWPQLNNNHMLCCALWHCLLFTSGVVFHMRLCPTDVDNSKTQDVARTNAHKRSIAFRRACLLKTITKYIRIAHVLKNMWKTALEDNIWLTARSTLLDKGVADLATTTMRTSGSSMAMRTLVSCMVWICKLLRTDVLQGCVCVCVRGRSGAHTYFCPQRLVSLPLARLKKKNISLLYSLSSCLSKLWSCAGP